MASLFCWEEEKMSEELKPCPFCGGEAKGQYGWMGYNCHQIVCSKCGTMTEGANTYEEAAEKWNQRTTKKPRVEAQSCFECEYLNGARCKLFDNAIIADTSDKNCGIENEL